MLKIIKRLIVLLCFPCMLYSQERIQILDFDSLWSLVEQRNPSLAVYKLNVQIAEDNKYAARSFLLPSITASASGQNNFKIQTTVIQGKFLGQPNETFYAQFNSKINYAAGLTLNYSLFDWQSITRKRQAENYVNVQEAQEMYFLQTLKNQTASLFYQALVLRMALDISIADMELTDSIVAIMQRKYDEGVVALIDLNQAKINNSTVEQNKLTSENLLDSGINQLKILLGLSVEETLSLDVELPFLPAGTSLFLGEDKQLYTYPFMIKDAEHSYKSQWRQNMPRLSFDAYYGANMYNSALSGFTFKSSQWHPQQYIGLSLTIPVFTGLNTLYNTKAAKKNVDVMEVQYDAARKQSGLNDRLLLESIVRKRASVEKAYESFRLYGENISLYHAQFNEGALELKVFLTYFQDYLTAQNSYLSQLSDYYNDLSIIISRN
ncbi:MAG: TolC family protein [Tannerellaceae bacterium]